MRDAALRHEARAFLLEVYGRADAFLFGRKTRDIFAGYWGVTDPIENALIRWLMDTDLVDEINLFTCPVIIGQGTRLFPDTGRDRAFALIESQTTPGGVIIQVYRPASRCSEIGGSRRGACAPA